MDQIREFVLRMARQGLRQSYTGNRDSPWNIERDVARTMIADLLAEHGIEPAAEHRIWSRRAADLLSTASAFRTDATIACRATRNTHGIEAFFSLRFSCPGTRGDRRP